MKTIMASFSRKEKLKPPGEHGKFPLGTDRLLNHAYIAERRLKPEVSWRLRLEHQLQCLLIPSPTEEQPHRRQFSVVSAQSQHIQQLSLEMSSKSMDYHLMLMAPCSPSCGTETRKPFVIA